MQREKLKEILAAHTLWLQGSGGERADLRGADLRGANLRRADLCGANLRDADLCGAENLNMPIACPESGSFVGWKAAQDDLIVKLQIEEDALRSSATGRKCRCSKATVLEIQNIDGTPANVEFATSRNDKTFTYRVGETLCVSDFDPNRWNECAPGIHFFVTRQEAVEY